MCFYDIIVENNNKQRQLVGSKSRWVVCAMCARSLTGEERSIGRKKGGYHADELMILCTRRGLSPKSKKTPNRKTKEDKRRIDGSHQPRKAATTIVVASGASVKGSAQ